MQQSHHEHHFHVTMSAPNANAITGPQNLVVENKMEGSSMFDLPYNPIDASSLVQVTTPSALSTPQSNWISNDPPFLKALTESIKNSGKYNINSSTYIENGPLGIPAITWETDYDYIRYRDEPAKSWTIMPQALSLARTSCFRLDIKTRQAGAWGPECKISKFIKLPNGELSPPTWLGAGEGDYMYTPPSIGTDTTRFILENGVGRKVDVTVKLKIMKWAPEANRSPDTGVLSIVHGNQSSGSAT